jgi:DnaJ family protein A protein 5
MKEILGRERREAELQRFQENEEYFRNKNEEIVVEQRKEEVGFYCEACDKEFKSESQMKNHNNSKMHKSNIKELIQSMTSDRREQDELMR